MFRHSHKVNGAFIQLEMYEDGLESFRNQRATNYFIWVYFHYTIVTLNPSFIYLFDCNKVTVFSLCSPEFFFLKYCFQLVNLFHKDFNFWYLVTKPFFHKLMLQYLKNTFRPYKKWNRLLILRPKIVENKGIFSIF